jgi:peptidyl-Asp metalloendopeptidase
MKKILFLAALWYHVLPATAQRNCFVHLIVAYTPEAAQQAGGDSVMVAQIQRAVLRMNEAYANSLVGHWIQLVRTEKINYSETGCFEEELQAFRRGTDPAFAHNHWLRGLYRADLAALIVANDQFCGLPYSDQAVATASTAFCAVQYDCMVHNFSLAHMLGHLYGCAHAQFELDAPQKGAAFPYGHGYHWDYNQCANFYTIMGVDDDVNCRGQEDYDCNLINYFSNPDVQYQGVPTGDTHANNARVLNEQAPVIGNFYTIPGTQILSDTVRTVDFALGIGLDTLRSGPHYRGLDRSNVVFMAGDKIVLDPGFYIEKGARFETVLRPGLTNCSGK